MKKIGDPGPRNPCKYNKSLDFCKESKEAENSNLIKGKAEKILVDIALHGSMKGLKRFADRVRCVATFGTVCPKPKSVLQSTQETLDMIKFNAEEAKKVVPMLIKALNQK